MPIYVFKNGALVEASIPNAGQGYVMRGGELVPFLKDEGETVPLGDLSVGLTVWGAGVPYTIVEHDHYLKDTNYPADCTTLWCEETSGLISAQEASNYGQAAVELHEAKTSGLGNKRRQTTFMGRTTSTTRATVTCLAYQPGVVEKGSGAGADYGTQQNLQWLSASTSNCRRYKDGIAIEHYARDGSSTGAGRAYYFKTTGVVTYVAVTAGERESFALVNLLKTTKVRYNQDAERYEIVL